VIESVGIDENCNTKGWDRQQTNVQFLAHISMPKIICNFLNLFCPLPNWEPNAQKSVKAKDEQKGLHKGKSNYGWAHPIEAGPLGNLQYIL
jgi:hypothetical protein